MRRFQSFMSIYGIRNFVECLSLMRTMVILQTNSKWLSACVSLGLTYADMTPGITRSTHCAQSKQCNAMMIYMYIQVQLPIDGYCGTAIK